MLQGATGKSFNVSNSKQNFGKTASNIVNAYGVRGRIKVPPPKRGGSKFEVLEKPNLNVDLPSLQMAKKNKFGGV